MLLTALCLHLAARGQTGYKYEYWFDNDRGTLLSGTVASDSWQINADVSGLRETLHTIHLQVSDADGNLSSPVTRYFIKTTQRGNATGRYWFDDATDQIYTSAQVQGMMEFDVSRISEGFHTIHYQVLGTKNNISSTAKRSFYKTYMPSGSSWRCWFDNDLSTQKSGKDMEQTLLLDISDLADGYHVLHIQVDGGAKSASVPITKPFIKVPQTIGVDNYTCLCMVDDQLYKQEKISAGQGVIGWNIDVSSLPQGFHRIYVQMVTPSGAASNTWQSFFLRETTKTEFAQMKCVYAIDGAEYYTEAGNLGNGTYHFDLDVSSLDNGLHRIAYMLSNGMGVTTKAQCQFFVKTPLGGNGVTEYWYWLNDQADSGAKKVSLPERKDPFSLITLLPVESQPLRSSLFQFRVEQGRPVIYSMNDIHLRFFDAAGRFTDVSKQFVDERVKQDVEPTGKLQPTQTFPKVAENGIRWYTMYVSPGDTVAFKLSQPATLQVFAPSGAEVFRNTESASVKWNGVHTWEDGTYYVAVHDVTGSQSNMTLDYMHMDKYDVVGWDVHTVGNGGCSTITFKGNGFRDLYSVDLVIAPGDTIRSVDVGHESDSETSATFDFSGAKLGEYKAVFHFADDDKLVDNIVTVEEATPFEFTISAQFEKQFLLSRGNSYSFTIENKGNMTAYDVPVGVFVYAKDSAAVNQIEIVNYDLKKQIRESLSNEYTSCIDSMIENKRLLSKDRYYFLEQDGTTFEQNLPYRLSAFIVPTLRPLNGETLSVFIKTENVGEVAAYMCLLEDMDEETMNGRNVLRTRQKSLKNTFRNMCAHKQELMAAGVEEDPYPNLKCPEDPPKNNSRKGGRSSGVKSFDPNDIFGYLSDAGSKFIADSVARVGYTIEFENDTTFATAAAHTIVIKDTLDSRYFDMNAFMPTGIRIGKHETLVDETDVVVKNNVTSFVKTIDMRPAINAIAQVDGTFSHTTGIAEWRFTSLDPMTMEPTDDLMQGILPVNYDGTSGIGDVMFDIGVKKGKADGTEISNRASIVFDYDDPILTPTWTNTVDAVAPNSFINELVMLNDTTVHLTAEGSDERSGIWKYTWYVQAGPNAPWWKEGETESPSFDYRIFEDVNYGFCVLATDSAGNVEQKVIERERGLITTASRGDLNGDDELDVKDLGLIIDAINGADVKGSDLNGDGVIDIKDLGLMIDAINGKDI